MIRIHKIKMGEKQWTVSGWKKSRLFCSFIDHNGTQKELSASDNDLKGHFKQKVKKLVRFPLELYVKSKLPDDEQAINLDTLEEFKENKSKGIAENKTKQLLKKRRLAIVSRHVSCQFFTTAMEKPTSMTALQFITMDPVYRGRRDFGEIKDKKGVHLCEISPVGPDKQQLSPDNKETYKLNYVFKHNATIMIPHLPDGVHANNDKCTWFSVRFPITLLFFMGKYSGIYPPKKTLLKMEESTLPTFCTMATTSFLSSFSRGSGTIIITWQV